MPSMQAVYVDFSALRFVGTTLDQLHQELVTLERTPVRPRSMQSVSLTREIVLDQITYQYPSAQRSTLRSLDLRIEARSTVGLVGTTGSGKTTTVDVILGLLTSQSGRLLVDDVVIDDTNRPAWQASIG